MKRHVQETGVRLWAGDDLCELQSEPFRVIDDFFCQFGNMILSGCEVEGKNLGEGLVVLTGKNSKGEDVHKVAPVEAATVIKFPVYLSLQCTVETRKYADEIEKAIKEVYTAVLSHEIPTTTENYITINETGNIRFIDMIKGSTRKITLDNILELKTLDIEGDSQMQFDKNVLWNDELKPANTPFNTVGPGTLTIIQSGVSGEINESLNITYTSL